jgi:hypothetical protein
MNPQDSSPGDVPPGYETTDVNLRAVLRLAIGIVIGAVVVHVALWFLLRMLEVRAERRDPTLAPLTVRQAQPPPPRLQSAPSHDYRAFRAAEDQTLATYGWVDREEGLVRVPIEQAIELLVERGEEQIEAQSQTPRKRNTEPVP